jgi:hypothetical protein
LRKQITDIGHGAGQPTALTPQQYEHCLQLAVPFIKANGSIRNKQLREIAGIGYDQAIKFFTQATVSGLLVREGLSSATKYVISKQ